MKPEAHMVFTRAEITALADYAATQSASRTYNVVLINNVKLVLNGDSSQHRLTPEYVR